jgi:large subunit ribosomal protein L4
MQPTQLCPYPSTFLRSPMRRDILHKAVLYDANASRGTGGHTKTRGEVRASTRKILQQKGTGKARIGSHVAGTRKGGSFPMPNLSEHRWNYIRT